MTLSTKYLSSKTISYSTDEKILKQFKKEIQQNNFSGDICFDYAERIIHAVDNSIFQVLPDGVIYPRSSRDISIVLSLAKKKIYHQLSFTSKGGGTGTNGQALNKGLIIDLSKYMKEILSYDSKSYNVIVQPGLVLDKLNQELKKQSQMFGPTLSTSSRATLGGMFNTDASGKGSMIYGKTSENVQALQFISWEGSKWEYKDNKLKLLYAPDNSSENFTFDLPEKLKKLANKRKNLEIKVQKDIPKLKRFISGYNLDRMLNRDNSINLNYLLSGSEGTLGIVTQLALKTIPIPAFKKLFLMKYDDFDKALSSAKELLKQKPLAIETIDDNILAIARTDIIWDQVCHIFSRDQAFKKYTRAVNLVEITANHPDDLYTKTELFKKWLTSKENLAFDYYIAQDQECETIWNLRKKGVGLLGKKPGLRKPIPFVEDTVVPPENLAAYIKEFRQILKKEKLNYGMFGHVDVGCLHVRPALNMRNPEDEKKMKKISDKVAILVKKYGGVIWGEHGKGFRGEYNPLYYGKSLTPFLSDIKSCFDPHGKLNPGKIAPVNSNDKNTSIEEVDYRGSFDREIKWQFYQHYHQAIDCNGNGACHNQNEPDVMCPSYKADLDRQHSPKGRATLIREWLRNDKNHSFNYQVYRALNGCLSCKACVTECPIQVDIPEMKSRFLSKYYSEKPQPLKNFLVAGMESALPILAIFPRLSNFLLNNPISSWLNKNCFGMVDTPFISAKNHLRHLRKSFSAEKLIIANTSFDFNLCKDSFSNKVILLQDAFTRFYDNEVLCDSIYFLNQLNITVILAPWFANGKAFHIKGFRKKFYQVVQKNHQKLKNWASFGLPMITIEPSIALTYRQEYPTILAEREYFRNPNDKKYQEQYQSGNYQKDENRDYQVLLIQEYLTQLDERKIDWKAIKKKLNKNLSPQESLKNTTATLFPHCTESTNASQSNKQWKSLFHRLGFELNIQKVGCCGMAGTYGHELEHLETSKKIFKFWKSALNKDNDKVALLATGYSCRSQAKRFSSQKLQHPLSFLAKQVSRRPNHL